MQVIRYAPLEEAARRGTAVSILQRLLWEFDPAQGLAPRLKDRAGYLAGLQGYLTAAEQIQIFQGRPVDLGKPAASSPSPLSPFFPFHDPLFAPLNT